MVHELYHNKAAKTKDEQKNVAITQSPSSHLTEKVVETTEKKTCYEGLFTESPLTPGW